jgi:hypothetical protein
MCFLKSKNNFPINKGFGKYMILKWQKYGLSHNLFVGLFYMSKKAFSNCNFAFSISGVYFPLRGVTIL